MTRLAVVALLSLAACPADEARRPAADASADSEVAWDATVDSADAAHADSSGPDGVDSHGAPDVEDADNTDGAEVGTDTQLPECDHSGFVAADQRAEAFADHNGTAQVLYVTVTGSRPQAQDAATALLVLELYYPLGATYGPHTATLTQTNTADCHTCVLAFSGCDATGCAQTFLARSGTLSLTRHAGAGHPLTGALTDLVLSEVTIAQQTFVSTPVAGGETWCIEGLTLDVALVDDNAS